jgi:uncharacterized protein YoaH (UPF0181 family)
MSHFTVSEISKVSDHELIAGFQDVVIEERELLSLTLEYIAELDRRKLFFHYPSLRSFLVEEYGMEEWNAERKIRAARLLKRFPEIKDKLQSGKLNLTLLELAMGCAHREKLADSELFEILEAISGLSTRAAMREIASQYPHTYELPKDRIRPLTADHSEVRFVASHELLEKLESIRGLLAHTYSQGLSMGELIDVLATEYRERHHPEEKARRAKAKEVRREVKTKVKTEESVESPTAPRLDSVASISIQPQPRNLKSEDERTANQPLIHQLTNRDGYQCSFVDDVTGKRCHSEYKLEIDHIKAWSEGGKTELSNLHYLCSRHHQRVSFLQFGESSKYYRPKEGRVRVYLNDHKKTDLEP